VRLSRLDVALARLSHNFVDSHGLNSAATVLRAISQSDDDRQPVASPIDFEPIPLNNRRTYVKMTSRV